MTKTGEVIAIGAVAGIGLYLFARARAVSHLIISPGSIVNVGFTGGMPIVQATVMASNTSTLPVTINSLAGNLFSNGTLIGTVYNFTPMVIGANSMGSAVVNFMLQPIGIVNDLINAFSFNQFSQALKFEGFANVGLLQVPLNFEFTVGK